MKVKIIKASTKNLWYIHEIGEVYEVVTDNTNMGAGWYKVEHNKTEGVAQYILVDDCERVGQTSKEPQHLFLIYEDGVPVRLVDSMNKFRDHDSKGKRKTWLGFDVE